MKRIRGRALARQDQEGGQVTSIQFSAQRVVLPFVPPEMLARYEQLVPGSANRVMAVMERQAAHRQDMEKTNLLGNQRAQIVGVICATIVALAVLGLGAWMVAKGQTVEGLSTVIIDLASLVGVFIWGKRAQTKKLTEQRRILEEAGRG